MSRSSSRTVMPSEVLLDGFVGYLRSERGVSELTVDAYVAEVRRFLAGRGGGELSELTAADVSHAVLGRGGVVGRRRRCGASGARCVRSCATAISTGLVERDLSAAALPVSGRRRSLLPQGHHSDAGEGVAAGV